MTRDIRNLITVVGIVFVRKILSELKCIVYPCVHKYIFQEPPSSLKSKIEAADFNLSEIHHCPSEKIRCRHSHNLVLDFVVIDIGLSIDIEECDAREISRISQSDVVLVGVLRIELHVSHKGVIQIVERGHAENTFIKCPDVEIDISERTTGSYNGRRPLLPVGRRTAALYGLAHKCAEHTALQPEPVIYQRRRQCHQSGMKQIELIVSRQIDVPMTVQRKPVGH